MQAVIIPRTPSCLAHAFNGSIIALSDKENGCFSNVVKDEDYVLLNVYRNGEHPGSPCNLSCKLLKADGSLDDSMDCQHITEMESKEDPRLFVYNGKLMISYNHVYLSDDGGSIDNVKVHVAEVTPDFEMKHIDINYKVDLMSWEKNWLFLEFEQGLWMIYQLYPSLVIVDPLGNKTIHPWKHRKDAFHKKQLMRSFHHISRLCRLSDLYHHQYDMDIRGGAHPVKVGNLYYLFAHTRERDGTLYRMLVVVLDADDLKVHAYTDPLEIPGYEHARIIYPIGAVYDEMKGIWYVSCGLEDKDQLFVTIPHDYLKQQLIKL